MKQTSKQKFTLNKPHPFLIKPNKKSCSNPRRSCFLTTTLSTLRSQFLYLANNQSIYDITLFRLIFSDAVIWYIPFILHVLRYQGQAPRRYHWHSLWDCNTLSLGPETVLVLELLTGIGMSLSLTFHHSIRQYHLQKVSAVCTHIKVVFPKFHFKARSGIKTSFFIRKALF